MTHWSRGGWRTGCARGHRSRTTRSPGCGGGSACSRTARRGSSSPPTRSWRPRSATSSGCTWTRRRTRSCSAWMRSPRSRRWTGPSRSCRCGPGIPERQTHDYIRHGTTTLFAALEIATGKVTDACYPRHRHQEFLRFLKKVAAAYPRPRAARRLRQLRHPQARRRPRRGWRSNPRITLHFTPTPAPGSTWWSASSPIITRQAIRRGTFTSVARAHRRHRRLHRPLERPLPARSPGPRTPTRSSPKPPHPRTATHTPPQRHATRRLVLSSVSAAVVGRRPGRVGRTSGTRLSPDRRTMPGRGRGR